MAKKATPKKARKRKTETAGLWAVYLANGELFARLSFPGADVAELFPGARIDAGAVYLA